MIHVSSLSKVVGPGLRVGWVAARGPISERIAMAKLLADFQTSTLTQHMAARWLASGAHDRHEKKTVPFYRERRDALMEALERHLPGEYRADVAQGRAPRVGHAHAAARRARALLGGGAARRHVHPGRGGHAGAPLPDRVPALLPAARSPEELDEGVRRLARAIREVRRRARHSVAAAPIS